MIRFITTILLAAAMLAAVWYLPTEGFRFLILFITGLGLWEYGKLVFTHQPTRVFLLLIGLAVAGCLTWWGMISTLFILLVSIFFSFLWVMWFKDPLEGAIHRVGLIVLGICYLGLTLPFWSIMREYGREWVMLIIFPACLTDTFGFLVGKAIGRRKLAPIVSPNKTWEGVAGSLVGATFGLWLAHTLFFSSNDHLYYFYLIFGPAIAVIAIFGDLIESLIKRSVHVKDSSHLIPGHGGALDRLDALIFTAPCFVLYLMFSSGWVHR